MRNNSDSQSATFALTLKDGSYSRSNETYYRYSISFHMLSKGAKETYELNLLSYCQRHDSRYIINQSTTHYAKAKKNLRKARLEGGV